MKDKILATAMQLANLHGFGNVTRDMIATKADVAVGLPSYYFGTMKKLERAMVEQAIATENLKILGQAIARKHPVALKAPEALRIRAVRILAA